MTLTISDNSPDLWLASYPWPDREDHKYSRGHVLVLGGDIFTGASRLSARGAQRIGAGLVTIAAPASVWTVYATALTSIMVQKVESCEDFAALLTDRRKNVIVIGPGAGVGAQTRAHVLAALATRRAVVLDADAITSFAETPEMLLNAISGPCILTPHEGEFSRLFARLIDSAGDRVQRARQAAALSGAVVLLKGADTVIAAPDGRVIVNSTAPPDLATAGSGDVLTGFIAGLMAQGLGAYHSAAAAAWLHGEAATEFGPGLIADDLPDILPGILRRLKNNTS